MTKQEALDYLLALSGKIMTTKRAKKVKEALSIVANSNLAPPVVAESEEE